MQNPLQERLKEYIMKVSHFNHVDHHMRVHLKDNKI